LQTFVKTVHSNPSFRIISFYIVRIRKKSAHKQNAQCISYVVVALYHQKALKSILFRKLVFFFKKAAFCSPFQSRFDFPRSMRETEFFSAQIYRASFYNMRKNKKVAAFATTFRLHILSAVSRDDCF